MNAAVLEEEMAAVPEVRAVFAALINLGVADDKVRAVAGADTVYATAEEAAVGDFHIPAPGKLKHIPGAGTGRLAQMSGRQIADADSGAGVKAQHIRIARCRLERGYVFSLTDDLQVPHPLNHQARAVVNLHPVIIYAACTAVIASRAEVDQRRIHINHAVAADGGEEFIRGCDMTDRCFSSCLLIFFREILNGE